LVFINLFYEYLEGQL